MAYAGPEGDLEQNSYADFVDQNPFVSPTLFIEPTDNNYDFYAGLKGKLVNSVAFNLRASYNDDENKALFKSNAYDFNNLNKEGYTNGNSFNIVYDKVL